MGHWFPRNAICLIVLVAVGLAVYLAWVYLPFGLNAIGWIGWIAMMLAGPLLLTDLEKRIKMRQSGTRDSVRRHAPLTVLKWFILEPLAKVSSWSDFGCWLTVQKWQRAV